MVHVDDHIVIARDEQLSDRLRYDHPQVSRSL